MDPDWRVLSADIRRMTARYAGSLSVDTLQGVEHYLNHDEYELALEGLCLNLMRLSSFSSSDREACQELARRVGLDRESVLDAQFWDKLTGAVDPSA